LRALSFDKNSILCGFFHPIFTQRTDSISYFFIRASNRTSY